MVTKSLKKIFASDIDNTLTGDRQSLDKLAQKLKILREKNELFLILSTGRRLEQVLDGFHKEGIPQPDAVISQVGTEIYLAPFSNKMNPLKSWEELLHKNYYREQAEEFFKGIKGAQIQSSEFNTPLKVSFFLDKAPDPEAAAIEIKQRVKKHGQGNYQVVWSSGRDLDILPMASGKGKAIRFLIQHIGLNQENVFVAGDSGNDQSMFDEFLSGIVVGNAQKELKQGVKKLSQNNIYLAKNKFAKGVEEGLLHFNIIDS